VQRKEASKRFLTLALKKHRTWHVFITDEDYRAGPLRRQALKGLPEGISIYSAVFDVGRSDITVEDLKAFEEYAPEDSMDLDVAIF